MELYAIFSGQTLQMKVKLGSVLLHEVQVSVGAKISAINSIIVTT
jgi:hypothetical protein